MAGICLLASSFVMAAGLVLAVPEQSSAKESAVADPRIDRMPERPVVTQHGMRIGERMLRYTATAGTIPVLNDRGETEADIFYVAYTADGGGEKPRPLVFAFNGGPGSSSAWLHLGNIGPKRIAIDPRQGIPKPPYRLEENPWTWLRFADVVLVDPVGTGLSRSRKPDLMKRFASVDGDVDSLGRFIRLYTSRESRWRSPVFLAGESYGTMRVAGLANYLQNRGIGISGVILLSAILDKEIVSYASESDMAFHLLLPSLTATAWHHRKLPPYLATDLEAALREAEEFAGGDYQRLLSQGSRLSAEDKHQAAMRLARLTGLSERLVAERDLRIDGATAASELLRDRSRILAQHDTRLTVVKLRAPFSPSNLQMSILKPAFAACLKDYLDTELEFRTDREYFISGEGISDWDWRSVNAFTDVRMKLAETALRNPFMGIFAGSGIYDLVTPYFAVEYMFSHMELPPAAYRSLVRKKYPGGHMMYLDPDVAKTLSEDVKAFVEAHPAPLPTGPDAGVTWMEEVRSPPR